MKIRFYPKTESVRNVLVGRINEAQELFEEDASAVANAVNNLVKVPGELEMLTRMAEASSIRVKDLKSQLTLLESHGPPEVMCEIEL